MIAQDQSEARPSPFPAEELIPPRPNLDPEPWGNSPPASFGLWPGVVVLGLFALVVWRAWRKRASGERNVPGDPLDGPPFELPSPGLRWRAASERVRSSLIAAFGPAWASKTSEEIAADPTLEDRLEPGTRVRLLAFLEAADHAKFAGEEPVDIETWEVWAEGFPSTIRPPAAVTPTGRRSGRFDPTPSEAGAAR